MQYTVDVKWKKAAADLVWRGADRLEGSAGFVLMTSPPTDKVAELLPVRTSIPRQYLNELLGKKMKAAVAAHAPPGEAELIMTWLRVSATTGRMPFERVDRPLSAEQANPDIRGTWGDKVKIGAGSIKGDFFLLEGGVELESCEKFWELPPPNEEEKQAARATALAVRNSMALPQIRYQHAALPDPILAPVRIEERHVGLVNRVAEPGVLSPEPLQAPLAVEAAAENQDAPMDEDEEEERPQYGAPWENCQQGWIAVVSVDFVDKKGVDVVLISEVFETDEDEESGTFTGTRYKLDSRSLDQGDEKCLDQKWWMPLPRNREVQTYRGWWVLEYVASLTAGGKLPAQARRSIKAKIKEQKVGTFQPIERGVEDGSDDDEEYVDSEGSQISDGSDDGNRSRRGRKRQKRTGAQ